MSCDHELANEWACCSGKSASYITINYMFSVIFFFLLGAGPSIPYWDFHGSTFLSTSYIRLTPDHQSKKGGLWNSVVGVHIFFYLTSSLSMEAAWPNTLVWV